GAIGLLVTAAAEAAGDAAVIVAATGRVLTLDQGLHRLPAVEARAIDDDQIALARRRGLIAFECHDRLLQARGHVDAVTFFESHHGPLGVLQFAGAALEDADLTLADQRVDALDLDVEELFDRFL